MSNRPVLVVGAGGFIGSHLAARLLADGYHVHCVYHLNASRLPSAGIHHQADLGARGVIHDLLSSVKPHSVFNCAQAGPRAVHQPGYLSAGFTQNIQGLINLLDACHAAGVERFVHACSSTIYADVGDQPMDEMTTLAPASTRGLCKLTERNVCLHYTGNSDLHVVLARVFRAYGPNDRPEKLIQSALAAQAAAVPVKLPAAPSRRDYVYVDDVVDAFLRMATRPLNAGTEINIGSGSEHRPDEILDWLEAITDRPIERQHGAYQPGKLDRAHWRASIGRAEQLLGWRPATRLQDGLRKTVNWFERSAAHD